MHDEHFKIYNIPTTESFDHAVKFMIKEYCQKGSQIISMVKKNDYGTQRINHDFQHSLNYDSHEVIEYKHQIFHVNDQIMMIHNNYDRDYFNGDMGIVRKIENETLTIEMCIRDRSKTSNLEAQYIAAEKRKKTNQQLLQIIQSLQTELQGKKLGELKYKSQAVPYTHLDVYKRQGLNI